MIDTVLFDMGGTLEDISHTEKTATLASAVILELLRLKGVLVKEDETEFSNKLFSGLLLYKQISESNHIELKPEQIWTDYCLRDFAFDRNKIIELSEELAHAWEVTYYNRKLRPGVPMMLEHLRKQGMKLGIISNTASLFQVFTSLKDYGIRDYFNDITLSSITGYRKPHKNIFEVSLNQMNSRPENCIYVGDTRSRDIIGSKNAGFAVAVQIRSFLTEGKDVNVDDTIQADYVIDDIYDLVRIVTECR